MEEPKEKIIQIAIDSGGREMVVLTNYGNLYQITSNSPDWYRFKLPKFDKEPLCEDTSKKDS